MTDTANKPPINQATPGSQNTTPATPSTLPSVVQRVVASVAELTGLTKPQLIQTKGQPAPVVQAAPEEDDTPDVYVIAPGLSCAIFAGFTEEKVDPLEYALSLGYKRVYIVSKQGTILHTELVPGADGRRRFVRDVVETIPRLTHRTYAPNSSFLPAGKVPFHLLSQVKKFFKDVIRVKKAKLEAMIWILWDPARQGESDKGYYLHVPAQRVAGASVSYDWSDLPAGSQLIVDIHSHADFSAFFSGTDDRDDNGSVRYSGVIGHNDKPTQEWKWRFCNSGKYRLCEPVEIFDEPGADVSIPEEWLDKVTTHTYSPPASFGYQGYHGGQGRRSYQGNHPFGYGAQGSFFGGDDSEVFEEPSLKKAGGNPGNPATAASQSPTGMGARVRSFTENKGGSFIQVGGELIPLDLYNKALRNGSSDMLIREYRNRRLAAAELAGMGYPEDALEAEFRNSHPALATTVDAEDAKVVKAINVSLYKEDLKVSGDIAQYTLTRDGDLKVEFSAVDVPALDHNMLTHGKEAALAMAALDAVSPELTKSAALLTEAVADLFSQVPSDEQLVLLRALASTMSRDALDKLAAEGL